MIRSHVAILLILAGWFAPAHASESAIVDRLLPYLRNMDPSEYDSDEELAALYVMVQRVHAVAEYARERGLDQDPVIQQKMAQMLQEKVIRAEVDGQVRLSDITDDMLQTYYETHPEEFEVPARLEGHLVEIAIDLQDSAAQEAAWALAEQAVFEAESLPGFQAFAAANSVHESRTRGGSVGPFFVRSYGGQEPGLPPALVAQLSALREPGAVSGVIPVADRLYVFRLGRRWEAVPIPLAQVREQVRYRLYRERWDAALDTLMESVAPAESLRLNDDQLRILREELAARVMSESPGLTTASDVPTLSPKEAP